jgi:hypothetical protein
MSATIAQQNEALVRQIAEDLEAGMPVDGRVVYDGMVTTREDALRRHDEAIITARKSAYYDPQDSIDEFLAQGPARMRLRSNLTWGLGYRVIGALRDVVYRMGEHARETGHVDKFNSFISGLADAKNSADYAETMGYAHYGSGITKACALYTVYSQWRELAIKEYGIARVKLRADDLPSLEKLADQPPVVDPSETEKMVLATRLMLEGEDAEVVDEAVRLVFRKAEEEHLNKIATNKSMAPVLKSLISELREIEGFAFHELDINTQGTLINSTLVSAKKIPTQLAKMRSVSTLDMVTAIPQLRRLQAKLEDVLSDSRFDV